MSEEWSVGLLQHLTGFALAMGSSLDIPQPCELHPLGARVLPKLKHPSRNRKLRSLLDN
jgi:hypothetical protein